jgi:hypothetical protein
MRSSSQTTNQGHPTGKRLPDVSGKTGGVHEHHAANRRQVRRINSPGRSCPASSSLATSFMAAPFAKRARERVLGDHALPNSGGSRRRRWPPSRVAIGELAACRGLISCVQTSRSKLPILPRPPRTGTMSFTGRLIMVFRQALSACGLS